VPKSIKINPLTPTSIILIYSDSHYFLLSTSRRKMALKNILIHYPEIDEDETEDKSN